MKTEISLFKLRQIIDSLPDPDKTTANIWHEPIEIGRDSDGVKFTNIRFEKRRRLGRTEWVCMLDIDDSPF